MNNYRSDMPIKEWLQYRINSIDKSLRFSKRYGMWIAAIIWVCIFGGSLFGKSGIKLYVSIVTFTITTVFILWMNSKQLKKGYQKIHEVRDYLQRLYDGIGE